MVLEKTLESLLDNKEIKPVSPKGNQPWIIIGRTDAEAEAPIFWPPDVKGWLIGKDPDAGKDWGQEEKETVGWHHGLNGHEFEQTPGDSEGQGSLVCCSPWCHTESDMIEWLNNHHHQQQQGFPDGSVVKNPPAKAGDAGDMGSIPGLGRSLGVGYGNPLKYSCLENFMDKRAWQSAVHGVAKSWTWLSDRACMHYQKIRIYICLKSTLQL